MLTGDKLETATCIAKSSRLVSKNHNIHVFKTVSNRIEAHQELNAFRRKQDTGNYFLDPRDYITWCVLMKV